MKLKKELIDLLIEEAKHCLRKLPSGYQYHNLDHTKRVMKTSIVIAGISGYSQEEIELLRLIAWYHDIGYIRSNNNHEEVGISILMRRLAKHAVDPQIKFLIADAIRSTKIDQEPLNELGKILCDADTVHLSYPNYSKYADSLREELSFSMNTYLSPDEWRLNNIDFFKQHQYYTDFAKDNFEDGKMRNLEALLSAQ